MLKQLEKDKEEIAHSNQSLAQSIQKDLSAIENKIQRLLSAYVDGALELVEYQKKKKELLEKRVSLQERLSNLGKGTDYWLEPMREWILSSQNAQNLETLEEKRNFLRKIGSNFILAGRKVRFSVSSPYNLFFKKLYIKWF